MDNMDSYFFSIDDHIFCPPILSSIRKQLGCEQAFICKLDSQNQLQYVIQSLEHQPKLNNVSYLQLYQLDQKLIEKVKTTNDSVDDDSDDDTEPLKKSELVIPLYLQTPEVIAMNNNTSLWGILIIYDYNYLRDWTPTERHLVETKTQELMLAIERSVIYQEFKNLEAKLKYYQFFDEETGLINYSSFLDCLDYEWRNLARQKKPLSVILIEINSLDTDQFQTIPSEVYDTIQAEIKRPADIMALGEQDQQILIMLPLTDNKGALWVNQKVTTQIKSLITDFESKYQYRSSIVTCVPNLRANYESLLTVINAPWADKLKFENNLYNQNLV